MRQIHRPLELTRLRSAPWIISGILSLAVLTWVAPANAQKTYTLSVSRHRDVPALTAQEIVQILAKASQMLQKDARHNSDNDVACSGVRIQRTSARLRIAGYTSRRRRGPY